MKELMFGLENVTINVINLSLFKFWIRQIKQILPELVLLTDTEFDTNY